MEQLSNIFGILAKIYIYIYLQCVCLYIYKYDLMKNEITSTH